MVKLKQQYLKILENSYKNIHSWYFINGDENLLPGNLKECIDKLKPFIIGIDLKEIKKYTEDCTRIMLNDLNNCMVLIYFINMKL